MRPHPARSPARCALLSLAVLGMAAPLAAQAAWKLGLNASETWDTNVRLGTATNGNFATRLSGKLERNFEAPRWQLALSGAGSKSLMHGRTRPRPGGIFYTTSLQFGYQLSERASLGVQDNFKSSFTGESLGFAPQDEDVLLPRSAQKRNHLRASLALQVSELTSATLTGTYDTSLFKPIESSEPRLTNGDKLAANLRLSRKLSTENAINIGYTLARSDQRTTVAYIHGLSLGFSHVLGEFTTSGVSIGASRRESTTATTYALTGGLAVSREFENSSLSLSYGRNLAPLFGLGRDVVHDTVRVSGQRPLTRSLSLAGGGSFSRNRDPLERSFSYNAWSAHASLNASIFRSLHLGGLYDFFKRSPLPGETGRSFEAHRFALQFGWNTAF